MSFAFEQLKESRNRLISLLADSREMDDVQGRHTEMVDQYFRTSLEESRSGRRLFSGKVPFALVAVGGYGRKELAVHSDVDILILFGHRIPDLARGLTEEILYPLWDLGLDLGYGTRTIKDCLRLSKDDFEVLTSLLDARFLCGDSPLFLDLMAGIQGKVVSKKKEAFARGLEDLHQIRMERNGDASVILEPDLKEGVGGLRDYHHILWVAKAYFELMSPRDLETTGKLSHNEYMELGRHLAFIWMVRNHLHQLSNRKNDCLHFEYQEKTAPRLGYRDQGGLLAVEQFMGDLHAAMASVKALNRAFVRAHLPRERGLWKRVESVEVAEGFHVRQGEIGFDSATGILRDPLLLMALFVQSSHTGCPLSMEARRLVTEFLPLVDDDFRRSPEAVSGFRQIVNGEHAFDVLNQMHEVGFLSAFIPEFGDIANRVQFDAYHTFPVGRHSLETLRRLKGIRGEKDLFLLDILLELPDVEPLLLAGLFHDIGKTGEDHSVRGVEIARRILERFQYPKRDVEEVLFLVRHHLLLVETATRRDLADEKSVVHCARLIGSHERLRMLYLLTWADSMATGPRAWSDWIANLVQELFFKVLHILAKGELATVDASEKARQNMDEVRRFMALGKNGLDPEPYFEVMSPRYLLNTVPRDMIRHIEMVHQLKDPSEGGEPYPFLLEARENEGDGCAEVTFLATDRPGLFSDMAGVLALNSLNVLSADIYTWRDGTAVDIFKVTRPLDAIHPEAVWERVREDLKRTFEGKLSLPYRLGQKRSSPFLSTPEKPSRPPEVVIDNASSDFFTVIEVFADDRVGLLYLITKTLFDLRLDIRIAKIATKGDQIADVFYVRDLEGQKIEDEVHLREIGGALRYELR